MIISHMLFILITTNAFMYLLIVIMIFVITSMLTPRPEGHAAQDKPRPPEHADAVSGAA